MQSVLSVSEAVQRIVDVVKVGATFEVNTAAAWQHVLAENLQTTCDSPPFDKSLMDGFAISLQCLTTDRQVSGVGAETTDPSVEHGRSVSLNVVETVTAGGLPRMAVDGTTAVRIMTGSLLPDGTDCVVPVERVQFQDGSAPRVVIPRNAIIREGSLLRQGAVAGKGDRLLTCGTRLQAQHLAALAEFGFWKVTVVKRPTVAVLATGDELVAIDQPLNPGQIRNSNESMLAAQIAQSFATAIPLGIARDDVESLSERIQMGLKHDFLLLTGGVSAGILDLVPSQLAAAGVRQVFHGVHMKPGRPLWFGVFEELDHRCYVFGLPGNPVSSLACFELFVRTALRRFQNAASPAPHGVFGTLTGAVRVTGNRPTYHPCFTEFTKDGVRVRPVSWSGSSDIAATTEANGMALLEPCDNPYAAGTQVEVFLWDTSSLI